jgi:hypothetical protein
MGLRGEGSLEEEVAGWVGGGGILQRTADRHS